MFKRSLSIVFFFTLGIGWPLAATAQNSPLATIIVDTLRNDIVLAPPSGAGFISHEAHFKAAPGQAAVFAPDVFNQALVTQLATVPIGSPSGGFSFTLDSSTGTFQRATDSFGASFADRALTNGRGKLTVGLNHQYSNYSNFEGKSLKSDGVTFYLRHASTATPAPFFEGDLIKTDLKIDLKSTTTTVFANYGVTDRLDVALVVPVASVRMDATVDATILRFATAALPTLHVFPGGASTQRLTRAGFARGIGDLVLRSKYRLVDTKGGGIAAGVNLRLPTGDADNLLGTGATAITGTFIGSSAIGKFSPHVNIDYTESAHGTVIDVPNEVGYRFGIEFAASPKVTLSADAVGRSLFDAGRLKPTDTLWKFTDAANVAGTTTLHEYAADPASRLNLLSTAIGTKINVAGNLLVTANVLISMSSGGVQAKVTPVLGFDYSF